MFTITANPVATRKNPLKLGRQGESGVTQVVFDLTDLMEIYGEGVPVLLYQRPGDTVPYEPDITVEDTEVIWLVDETDTGRHGSGTAEFQWLVDGGVLKAADYRVVILKSLACVCETVSASQLWIDQLVALKQEAVEAAATSTDAAADSETAAETAETAAAEAAESATSAAASAESAEAAAEAAAASAETAEAVTGIEYATDEEIKALFEEG